MSVEITWLGHASMRLQADKVVYVDPWEVEAAHDADIVLVTHDHYDHCIPEDIEKVSKDKTVIVATADCKSKLGGDVRIVAPGDKVDVDGVAIEAVPAYNSDKHFHPKANNWVGYIITLGGKRIYQAGDTDVIPEMKDVTADVAILPVGGTYTMTANEAAEAITLIKPNLCIPMHYDKIVGTADDAREFAGLVDIECKILEPGKKAAI